MLLEKNKVYKIFHNSIFFEEQYPRDYLLICPKHDLVIDDGFVKGNKYGRMRKRVCMSRHVDLLCIFIVCFDGKYVFGHNTTVSEDCYFEELNDNDLNDIKGVLRHMVQNGERYQYNRKLAKIIKQN